jgi:hypothetical protein
MNYSGIWPEGLRKNMKPSIRIFDAPARNQATVNYRPILSSERAPHINKPPNSSNSNPKLTVIKNLVMGPRWVSDTKTDW